MDRQKRAGQMCIRDRGRNVTITLNNSSIHFDGEIPAVDLVQMREQETEDRLLRLLEACLLYTSRCV